MPVFDLVDVELVGRGVALLDDAQHPPRRWRRDDPPVAGRVVEHAREQRRRVAVGDVRRRPARRASRPRSSGVSPGSTTTSTSSSRSSPGERGHADRGGVAGAALVGLLDEARRWPTPGPAPGPSWSPARRRGRRRRPCAPASQPSQGVDDVHHHRPAADQVQRLRPVRPHPRALAGGQHDRGNTHRILISRTFADLSSGVNELWLWLRGEDSNPYTRHQKPLSYH